MYDHVAEKREK